MKIGDIIRHYPISCIVIVTIWTLCLIPIPETPLSNVSMIDKWTHIVMYGGFCAILLIEYGQRHKQIRWSKIIVGAVIFPLRWVVSLRSPKPHAPEATAVATSTISWPIPLARSWAWLSVLFRHGIFPSDIRIS